MGSGHSASVKSVEEQKPDTGTTLFGSWDNPVADAYALKKQRSKKVMDTAADAAGAAVGSSFQVDAGAGVNPVSTKAPAAKKTLGSGKVVKAKKGGESWTLSQSSKDPATVAAAKKALKGKLSKPMPTKPTIMNSTQSNREARTAGMSSQQSGQVAGSRQAKTSKLGMKLSGGVATKGKAVAGKASGLAEQAAIGASGARASVTTAAEGASTAVQQAATNAVQSVQKVVKEGVENAAAGTAKVSEAFQAAGHNQTEAGNSNVEAWTAGTSSKTAAQIEKHKQAVAAKLAVTRNSGVVKKSKATAAKAATTVQGAATATATAVQGAATGAKDTVGNVMQSVQKATQDSAVMEMKAAGAARVSEVARDAVHAVQQGTSLAVGQAGAAGEAAGQLYAKKGSRTLQDLHALKLSGAADWAKSEARRKSVAKAAKKAAKAKKAPKRMISEIDAQTASTEGLGRGKRQRKQVKAFEPEM